MNTNDADLLRLLEEFINNILEENANGHDFDNRMLNNFRQHFEDIVRDPEKSTNELEKELAIATKEFLEAINSSCPNCKKEKLDSAQEHLDKINEITGFYCLYVNLIKKLRLEIESAKKNM